MLQYSGLTDLARVLTLANGQNGSESCVSLVTASKQANTLQVCYSSKEDIKPQALTATTTTTSTMCLTYYCCWRRKNKPSASTTSNASGKPLTEEDIRLQELRTQQLQQPLTDDESRDFANLVYIAQKRDIRVTIQKGTQAGLAAGLCVMGGVIGK